MPRLKRWTMAPRSWGWSETPPGGADHPEFRAYLENLSSDFNPDPFLRQSAAATGKWYGCKYAVAFEVITI
jgi:hypothetical protein